MFVLSFGALSIQVMVLNHWGESSIARGHLAVPKPRSYSHTSHESLDKRSQVLLGKPQ